MSADHPARMVTLDLNAPEVIAVVVELMKSQQYMGLATRERRAGIILATLARYAEYRAPASG